jgi:ABC transporter substrate binding protein
MAPDAARDKSGPTSCNCMGDGFRPGAILFRSRPGGALPPAGNRTPQHNQLPLQCCILYFKVGAFAINGGLVSYGYDVFAQFSGAAAYVDRILKGEKPADLPVQAPTKYELVINLKTAKALSLTIPPSVLARAALMAQSGHGRCTANVCF